MARAKVLSIWKAEAAEKEVRSGANAESLQAQPRRFPVASSAPRLPALIPDEILDYYGWLFCQGGFKSVQMTFEGFLAVVAAVSPLSLCPEQAFSAD